jgi:Fe-S cluster biogenesis protein NfuA
MSEKVDALKRMLEEVLAPLIEADAGELYLITLNKKELKLHLGGAFAGSPACDAVTRRILEPAVRAVQPKLKVVVTNGFRVPDGAERIASRK